MLVELDRLYLLAGPKEEFEEQDSDLEQVYAARKPTTQLACHSCKNCLSRTLSKLNSKQSREEWQMQNWQPLRYCNCPCILASAYLPMHIC